MCKALTCLVQLGGPECRGHRCAVLGLVAGLLTGTGPELPTELAHDRLDAGVSLTVAEVAGDLVVSSVVNVQIQGVETVTILHHCVKNTEPLTLLQDERMLKSKSSRSNWQQNLTIKL